MSDTATEIEQLIQSTADQVSVLPRVPTLDNHLIHAFCTDLARNVDPPEEIATRYGMAPDVMVQYLRDHPMLIRRIKEIKAIWDSGVSIEQKTRTLACHTVLYAMPETGTLMFDKTVPASTRLDALKAHARIAGVDGLPPVTKDGGGAAGGQFNVIINLPGRVEDLSTTVVEARVLPAPGDPVAA